MVPVEPERCTDGGWTCGDEVRHFSFVPELEPRSAWMTQQVSTNAHEHHKSRVRVTKDRLESGKLTVKVPWKVEGGQAVKRYSVMDFGRDFPL